MGPQKLRSLLIVPALATLLIAAWPDAAAAQRRGAVGRRLVVRGGVYGPVFYDPWYSYGYRYGSPWYPYQIGYPYPPYGYYGRYDGLTASVRLEVTPRTTEVYVDGYRAGIVDDFDGFFQRLRLRPGEHELTLYLDGYRSEHQQVYLNFGTDQKIRHTMVPLQAGDQQDARPQPAVGVDQDEEPFDQPAMQPPLRPRGGGPGPGPGRGGPGRGGPPPQPAGPAGANAQYGSVSIRVQPADADVLIDGERWSGPATQDRLVVQLPGGRHRVEIRKDGYETYASEVDVLAGDTVTLNVSLLRR